MGIVESALVAVGDSIVKSGAKKILGGGKEGKSQAPKQEKQDKDYFEQPFESETRQQKSEDPFMRNPTQGGSFFAPPAKQEEPVGFTGSSLSDPDQFNFAWRKRMEKWASGDKL